MKSTGVEYRDGGKTGTIRFPVRSLGGARNDAAWAMAMRFLPTGSSRPLSSGDSGWPVPRSDG
jgi:hypothetical protein